MRAAACKPLLLQRAVTMLALLALLVLLVEKSRQAAAPDAAAAQAATTARPLPSRCGRATQGGLSPLPLPMAALDRSARLLARPPMVLWVQAAAQEVAQGLMRRTQRARAAGTMQ